MSVLTKITVTTPTLPIPFAWLSVLFLRDAGCVKGLGVAVSAEVGDTELLPEAGRAAAGKARMTFDSVWCPSLSGS